MKPHEFWKCLRLAVAIGSLFRESIADDGVGPDGRYVSPPPMAIDSVSQAIVSRPVLPEVVLYSAEWCVACPVAKSQLAAAEEKGELPFRIRVVESEKEAPAWVTTFPTLYWGNGESPAQSSKTWKISGWTSIKDVVDRFNLTRRAPPKNVNRYVASAEIDWDHIARTYSKKYIELDLGFTRSSHLERTHGLPRQVVEKYRRNQDAMDRLHGYCHEHGR